MSIARRLNVNLGDDAVAALDEVSHLRDTTATETIRRALLLLQHVEHEKAAGRVVIIRDRGGANPREIVIL